MTDVRFRPLALWPHPSSPQRRSRYTFKASWQNTLDLLNRELRHLSARDVIIAAGFREQDIRLDGWPRSNAQVPAFPGIEVSFSMPGQPRRMVYATDTCEWWQHNVRSIALGLEALRAVDRFGITRRGEQYAGFRELPAGRGDPNPEHGRQIIAEHGSIAAALKATHPDHGGKPDDFADVQAARERS